jgi:translin
MEWLLMELDKILMEIREEVEKDDKIRESALKLSRNVVRKCSESIKLIHRKEFQMASSTIGEAHKMLTTVAEDLAESSFLSRGRILDTAFQELAEATNLHSLLESGAFTLPAKYGIPARPYLNGLADVIGELRRSTLDHLRDNDVQKGVELLGLMEMILDELQTFDYPNALVPDLRRKCDVGRALVERTRADVTRAVRDERLIKELHKE